MEEIKEKLVESGVIGRVLYDFNPRMKLILYYVDTQINIGDEVTLAEVQRHPTYLEHYSDPLDLELQETFKDPKLVELVVMTDPHAPGGEYLHWYAIIGLKLDLSFMGAELDTDSLQMDPVAYEPPRPGAHMLVLTLFKAHEFQSIAMPNSRDNFSTRTFAHTNALGSPLGASFFNIKYENENEKQEGSESSTCNGARPCSKRQENGSTTNPKEILESTSKRRRISVSLGDSFSRMRAKIGRKSK